MDLNVAVIMKLFTYCTSKNHFKTSAIKVEHFRSMQITNVLYDALATQLSEVRDTGGVYE